MLKRLLLSFSLLSFSPSFAQFAGNALDFDGTDDMVVVNTVPALFNNLTTNNFTFEAWVNPRGSLFTRIFFAQPSTTNFASVSTSTGNVIYFYVIANGTTYSIATSAGIPQNQWTHVAARWNASTLTPQVLFNGVIQPGGAGGGSSTGTNGLMTLGTRPGGFQYFDGALDEARLWSEYRTDCQIQNNMNISITGTQTNLVANYVFNQGVAAGNNTGTTTLNDISGNSYNGTLNGFTLTTATSNWIASGATVTSIGNPVNGIMQSRSASVCSGGALTFPDGSTQTNIIASFVQTSTIPGPSCDTIINTTVSVNPVFSSNDTAYVCSGDNHTFADGSTQMNITSPVNHTSTLQTAGGCDSLVTTTVNVNTTYALSDSSTICSGANYTFADGSTQTNITATVIYTSMLSSVNGCDSAITTTVLVDQVDTSVTVVNETLTATLSGATYQWLDCANGYAILPGATNQSYVAIVNGTYAVSVTMNGCTDTSNCYLILSTGMNVSSNENTLHVYPNPGHDILNINTGGASAGTIELMDLAGKTVYRQAFGSNNFTIDLSEFASGVYLLNMYTTEGKAVTRLYKD